MGRLYYDAIAGTPDEGLIVAPHVHVHAAVRDRAPHPGGPVRVPGPPGPLRRWPCAGCLGRSCAPGVGRVGVAHGGHPRRPRRRGCWSRTRRTSGRHAGAIRPSGRTTPRPHRPPGPRCWAATAAQHRILSATEPAEVGHARSRGDSAPTRCPSAFTEGERTHVPLLPPGRGELQRPAAVVLRGAGAARRPRGVAVPGHGPRAAAGRGAAVRAQRGRARARAAERRDAAAEARGQAARRGVRRDPGPRGHPGPAGGGAVRDARRARAASRRCRATTGSRCASRWRTRPTRSRGWARSRVARCTGWRARTRRAAT